MKGKEMFTEEEVKAALEEVGYAKWGLYSDADYRAFVRFANALPAKREGEPIDRKDVREGDRVRAVLALSHGDMVIEAVAGKDATGWGNMRIGGYAIGMLDDLRLIHRPAPKLEAGMLIRVDEWRDGSNPGQVVFIRKMKTGELLEAVLPNGSQVETSWITKSTQIYPEPQS